MEGIYHLIDAVPQRDQPAGEMDSLSPVAPWRVVNLDNSAPVQLTEFIAAIEAATGRVAERNLMPIQPGDVPATWADTSLLQALTSVHPNTDVTKGVQTFVNWYRAYYQA